MDNKISEQYRRTKAIVIQAGSGLHSSFIGITFITHAVLYNLPDPPWITTAFVLPSYDYI